LDKTKPELIIEPNKFRFKDNKLTIKQEDFPKLKTLYACGLGLQKADINCPTLQGLYFANNKLTKIDNLESLTNLVNLVLTGNKFLSLDISKNTNLEVLFFNSNKRNMISSFLGKKKKKILNCQGLKKLKYLDCSLSGITELMVESCENLEVLDADVN
jgi:Leucine-rich repeat (LRR) protein